MKRRRFELGKVAAEQAATATPRVALYARVSSEEQAQEGYSLEGQAERLRAYATARGWTVAGEYIDGGFTARDIKRPEYSRMMSESDKWDYLTVLKMDRVHRNSRNFIDMMAELARKGKQFVSMTESLDTSTAMGRFVMDIMQRIAQLESEQIGERTIFGMSQKAKTGAYALGQRAPYGYHWSEGHPKFGTGRWIVDEDEAKRVRLIFELAAKGLGVPAISLKRLKWCTCKPREVMREYTRKDGSKKRYIYNERRWDCAGCFRVRYILNNPTYVGYFTFHEQVLKGDHKPLIDRRTFEKVQRHRYRTQVVLPPADGPIP